MDAETTSEPETNKYFFRDNDELNAMLKEWRKKIFQIEGLLTLAENINLDDKNKLNLFKPKVVSMIIISLYTLYNLRIPFGVII